MILRFFKNYQPVVYIFIILISIGLWITSFINAPQIAVVKNPMPLYSLTLSIIGNSKIAAIIFAYFIVLLQAFLLTRLNMKYLFIKVRSYLPSLIFILLTSGFTSLQALRPVLIGSLIILLCLDRILDTFNEKKLNFRFFEASIILGVGCLFYAPLIYFIVIIWIALIILRPYNWREWAFSVLGVFVSFIFTFSYFYIFKNKPFELFRLFTENLVFPKEIQNFNTAQIHFGIFLILILIIVSIFLIRIFWSKKAHSRRFFLIFFIVFISSLIFYFLIYSNFEIFYITALPFTLIIANYFSLVEKVKWGNFLLVIFILMTVYSQLLSYHIITY